MLKINELKDTIQDCNINFLIGAGMSAPYFPPLGSIEQLLTEIDPRDDLSLEHKKIIRASLYKKYFDDVIAGNIKILADDAAPQETLECYVDFLKILNSILLNRKSTILSKQVNVFTTNVDIFLEQAVEKSNVEYNDGFSGRFSPLFDLGNFKKSYFRRSLHYDNTSELPVFNLMKIHGSLTWEKLLNDDEILFDSKLKAVSNVKKKKINDGILVEIEDNSTVDELIAKINEQVPDSSIDEFLAEYEKLSIINPTKEKFKDTVLNQIYYELLRIFSNELEKENTILFVMGFSFADEHIRKIVVRAANSNPTLKIYILAHTEKAKQSIEKQISRSKPNNKNIQIFSPDEVQATDSEELTEMTFKDVNELVFNEVLQKIGETDEQESAKKA